MTGPTRPDGPARGGATWCEEHNRWECTRHVKATRGGGRCHGPAIIGVDRCRMHGGKRADQLKAEGEAVTAWSARGGEVSIVPAEAVLGMLQMSWLRASVYAELLEQQVAVAQASAVREPAVLETVGEAYGVVLEHEADGAPPVGPGTGLVGHTYSGVKDIGIFATGEAIRGLTQLEAAERDRCVKYAKTAHDMGIADRQIKLAEEQGALLAGVIGRVLDALDLTPGQRELVATVVPRELRAVAGGES
ncbi:MAG: hypothetical protein ACRDP6_14830 [Actinoallomurus sp.]